MELLTEYSKHTLFCLAASVECQQHALALKDPPRINNTSGVANAGLHDPPELGCFLFHPQLLIHIPLPKLPIRPGGRQTTSTATKY